MINGHAYARALRVDLFRSAALVTHILTTTCCTDRVSLNHLRTLHKMLRQGQCDTAGTQLTQN